MAAPEATSIKHLEDRRASWEWRARKVIGTEHVYAVQDENFDRLNTWKMVVQVPKARGAVIVRPLESPGRKALAGVVRKSIVFQRATLPAYRRYLYCKVTLADPSGSQTKFGMRRGERDVLPKWFAPLRRGMRLKGTVTTTHGPTTAQVLLARPDNHMRMVRIFFALKVWVLTQNYQLVN